MKILVPVKRVVDYSVRVRVKPDGSGIDLNGVKMAMNPFDEIALEEAIRLKEKGAASEIVLVTIGAKVAQDILRAGLAMGADRAVLVELPPEGGANVDSLAVAKLLARLAISEAAGLVLCGKQSIDTDLGAVGPMLAALLGWPQASCASRIEIADGRARIVCETDHGLRTLSVPFPAIVTADLRLNTPRFASLPNIMKARSKPLATISPAELGVDIAPRLTVVATNEPPSRAKSARRVTSATELVGALRQQGALK